jgi:hypothetical protein
MSISLRLIENEGEIAKKINQAIALKLNEIISKKSAEIIKKVQVLIRFAIKSQPEMLSLASPNSNSLIGQFGISNTSSIVENITEAIANSVTIKITPYNRNLKGGGLELNIQPTDFTNLLSLPDGHTIYENGDLHWLDWLLNRGNEVIVVGYEYNPQTGLGRSKLGNMKQGGSFRVPPEFSGTKNNNFITRALVNKEQENAIAKIFQQALGDI